MRSPELMEYELLFCSSTIAVAAGRGGVATGSAQLTVSRMSPTRIVRTVDLTETDEDAAMAMATDQRSFCRPVLSPPLRGSVDRRSSVAE